MVRLNLKVSHRHILPILILSLFVLIWGDPGEGFRCNWWSAARVCAILDIMAIAPFYIALPLINISHFKVSWVGLGLPVSLTMRMLVAFYLFLTYFAFVSRVMLISAAEAIFVIILFMTAMGNELNLFGNRSHPGEH